MSLQSISRYEQGTQKSAHLRQAFQMQADRIKNDEMMAERNNLVKLENIVSQRALWNESLEQSSWTKRIKEEDKKIKEELRMAAKASLAVRRVALQNLLAKEIAQYGAELEIQGKTFFKQRI
ncbi:hypothetical protein ACJMK2_043793 [Sinanodonta woodiana]|uniref:Flagellar FliJ protein n=1 Tax=Sinanodonta woodiana TaxID=1069815 RepID=A0ABD3W1L0_SINWO